MLGRRRERDPRPVDTRARTRADHGDARQRGRRSAGRPDRDRRARELAGPVGQRDQCPVRARRDIGRFDLSGVPAIVQAIDCPDAGRATQQHGIRRYPAVHRDDEALAGAHRHRRGVVRIQELARNVGGDPVDRPPGDRHGIIGALVELADEERVVKHDVRRRVGGQADVVVIVPEHERLRIDRIDERRGPGARAEPLPTSHRRRVERARQGERPEGTVGRIREPRAPVRGRASRDGEADLCAHLAAWFGARREIARRRTSGSEDIEPRRPGRARPRARGDGAERSCVEPHRRTIRAPELDLAERSGFRSIAAARGRHLENQLVGRDRVRQPELVPAGPERIEAHVREPLDRVSLAGMDIEHVGAGPEDLHVRDRRGLAERDPDMRRAGCRIARRRPSDARIAIEQRPSARVARSVDVLHARRRDSSGNDLVRFTVAAVVRAAREDAEHCSDHGQPRLTTPCCWH